MLVVWEPNIRKVGGGLLLPCGSTWTCPFTPELLTMTCLPSAPPTVQEVEMLSLLQLRLGLTSLATRGWRGEHGAPRRGGRRAEKSLHSKSWEISILYETCHTNLEQGAAPSGKKPFCLRSDKDVGCRHVPMIKTRRCYKAFTAPTHK